MSIRRAMTLTALLVAFLAISIGSAEAQGPAGCGTTCKTCGGGVYREGDEPLSGSGQFDLDCDSTDCVFCGSGGRVSDNTPDATAILEQVRSAGPADLEVIVAEFGHRLLLSLDRSLLVVQGSSCDPLAFVSLLFVPSAKAMALKQLGVRPLSDHTQSETDLNH